MQAPAKRLLLLCHSGSWDRLLQAGSAAATAAGSGWSVDVVFYFDALDKLMHDRLDDPASTGAEGAWHAALREPSGLSSPGVPSELFDYARSSGRARFLACSASCSLLALDEGEVLKRVDHIVGWPTVIELMGRAQSVLYL